MPKKKTWNEKLRDSKDLPKVVELTGKQAAKWGEGTMAIPAPMEVELMRKVRKGKLTTINLLRKQIAAKHGATVGCPITTGIFAWIAAHAAEEARAEGKKRVTPWQRTLKEGGVLNPKYPGGVERQMELLEAEGHVIVPKGKKNFKVLDFEKKLAV
ncbi:MAG: MGMT family protein [Chlorobi bacterium]|nr:MGMT family protein [Chlorobiota bacterium]